MEEPLSELKFLIWYRDPPSFFRDVFGEEPYPYQARILIEIRDLIETKKNGIRILLMAAGGTGKTKLLSAISLFITTVVTKMSKSPYSTIIISGSRDQARNLYEFAKVAFEDNDELAKQVDGEPLQHETKLKDRSLIKAVSKSLKAIQGQHHDVVIIDEAPLAGDFIIRDTLRIIAQSDKDIIILSGTPISQDMANEPIGELFIEYWEDEDKYPEWKKYHWGARDCPRISTESYMEAKKNLPGDMFEVFWEGKPHSISSKIYVINHSKLKISSKGHPVYQYDPEGGPVIAGLDWGLGTSLTVLIIIQYVEDEIRVLYTHEWKTEELESVHDQIMEICRRYHVRIVYADGAQKGENIRLADRGLYIEPIVFNQNKLEMQTKLRILFHQEKIKIPEEYQSLIQNLRKFTWVKKSGQDYSDAMCLAVYREEKEDDFFYKII